MKKRLCFVILAVFSGMLGSVVYRSLWGLNTESMAQKRDTAKERIKQVAQVGVKRLGNYAGLTYPCRSHAEDNAFPLMGTGLNSDACGLFSCSFTFNTTNFSGLSSVIVTNFVEWGGVYDDTAVVKVSVYRYEVRKELWLLGRDGKRSKLVAYFQPHKWIEHEHVESNRYWKDGKYHNVQSPFDERHTRVYGFKPWWWATYREAAMNAITGED